MDAFDHGSGEFLEITAAKIYFETAGAPDAAALLFLHGGFGSVEGFDPVLPRPDKSH